ncbi:MAG: hypothetical protein DRQ10_02320 [Candidatus Hydrothermota bacterium]|nr:MAG: hypothetical protein DRQ10_02320 [Candidatus Hydrothermae bacterium]
MTQLLLLSVLLSANIRDIRFESVGNAVIVSIIADAPIAKFDQALLTKPPRIIINLPGLRYIAPSETLNVGIGPVVRIIGYLKQDKPPSSRVIIELTKAVEYRIERKESNTVLRVTVGQMDTSLIDTSGLIYYPRRSPYFYTSRYKRDPFAKPKIKAPPDTLLDVNGARLVGIVETPGGRVAVVKAANGRGFVLHTRDLVKNGIVSEIGKDYVIFTISDYGFTRTVVLKLREEE